MMEVLPRQKMREFLNSGSADPQALMNLYAMFDNVYKSALELKALSLSMDVLAGKLVDLARQRNHAESVVPANDAAWQAAQDQRLGIIAQERDIHVQQLPEFLQTELAAAAGSVAGLTPSQALTHYKATLDRMAATKTAEIKPIQAPPPFSSGGITITFPAANPKINAPLSKPELEALNELVYLQTNTPVGVKWLSYHDALLKAESARHLTATSNAFGGLAERSNETEQNAEAKRLADEQARIAAEAEAKRVADEQARVAAEAQAYKNAVSFLADVNKDILAKYGENMSKVALGLQDNISGKKVRNYADAMKTFEKVRINPNIKLRAQDTQGVVDALNANKATFADNVNRLGKAFGVVGKIVQADAICKKTIIGFKTGDWKPLGLELESIAAGAVAGAAAGAALAAVLALLGAPIIITVPAVAIVMAFVASFLDSEKVDEINGYFIK